MLRNCRARSLAEALAECEVESHKKTPKRFKGSISEVYFFFRLGMTIRFGFGSLNLLSNQGDRNLPVQVKADPHIGFELCVAIAAARPRNRKYPENGIRRARS